MVDRTDRIAGALALSALGDAMGLPFEHDGLAGRHQLSTPEEDLPCAETFREPEPNPWNIWADFETTRGMRGVVSDDTAIKIALIEPWLTLNPPLEELDFRQFLDKCLDDGGLAPMARRLAAELTAIWSGVERPGSAETHGFYQVGAPANWGPFLYGTLPLKSPTLISCGLDQDTGVETTRFFLELVAEALRGPVGFRELLLRVSENYPDSWRDRIGVIVAKIDGLVCNEPTDAAAWVSENLYHSSDAPTHALKPFDPMLQTQMLVAYGLLSRGDPGFALKAAAIGAGDTDTVAAHLGLVMGAQLGWNLLRENPQLSRNLDQVESTIRTLFGVSREARVAAYR